MSVSTTEQTQPDEDVLLDGRENKGDAKSRYTFWQWIQILFELTYLVIVLFLGLFALFCIARCWVSGETSPDVQSIIGNVEQKNLLITWAVIGLSGLCGGCTASLKWLYHSVAKGIWNRDRFIWRVVVPILSSVISTFTGLMITSGFIPLLKETSLKDPMIGAAFGYFLGLFSDNVLASLQKLSLSIFGTVDKDSVKM